MGFLSFSLLPYPAFFLITHIPLESTLVKDSMLDSSPRLSSSAGDVERVVKTERDELRSSSIAMSSSPAKSPPPPAQTSSNAAHPPTRAPASSGTLSRTLRLKAAYMLTSIEGPASNVRQRAQEKNAEKRSAKKMGLSELTDGPFTRFETQTEIVAPLQGHATREDSVRKGELFHRIYALFLPEHDAYTHFLDLTSRLLLLLLETHAWLASRPSHERMNEIEKLEEGVKSFSEIEEQQGRSSSPVSAHSAHSYSTAATSVFANYEPEIIVANERIMGVYRPLDGYSRYLLPHVEVSLLFMFSSTRYAQRADYFHWFTERAREKLTQFVRHFTSAIQALAQGMTV